MIGRPRFSPQVPLDFGRRRLLPGGAVAIDRATGIGRSIMSCWIPCVNAMQDIRRNTLNQRNGAYVNTVNKTGHQQFLTAQLTGTVTSLATGAHALVSSDTRYDNPTNGAVSCWFWVDTLPGASTNNPGLVARSSGVNNQGIFMYIHYNSGAPKLLAGIRNATTTTNVNGGFAGETLKAGRWYHAHFNFRSGGVSELFLNGLKLDAQSSVSSVSMSGQSIYLGAHSQVGGGFFTTLAGRLGRCDWWAQALNHNEVRTLAKDMTAGLKVGRPLAFSDLTGGGGLVSADYADQLTWAGTFAREPLLEDALNWADAFIVTEPVQGPNVQAMTDTLTWSQEFKPDEYLADTLTWSGDAVPGFTLPINFVRDEDDIVYWQDAFRVDISELANGRYRR